MATIVNKYEGESDSVIQYMPRGDVPRLLVTTLECLVLFQSSPRLRRHQLHRLATVDQRPCG